MRLLALTAAAAATTCCAEGMGGGAEHAGWARLLMQRVLLWLRSPAGVVLLLLVLQSTSIVLLMRLSKTTVRAAGTGPAYASTVAIFLAELIKMPISLGLAAWKSREHGGLLALLRDEVLGNWAATCRTGVPALAYTVQGNLLFLALAHLEAPTYQAPPRV